MKGVRRLLPFLEKMMTSQIESFNRKTFKVPQYETKRTLNIMLETTIKNKKINKNKLKLMIRRHLTIRLKCLSLIYYFIRLTETECYKKVVNSRKGNAMIFISR